MEALYTYRSARNFCIFSFCYTVYSSSESSESGSRSGYCCCIAWLVQVWSLHISVHVRPFTRCVQSGNLRMRTREHLQASSINTTSGAEAECIQRMFGLLSSSVQPCSFGLGTLGLASKQRLQIAAWKLSLCACIGRGSLCMAASGLTLLPLSMHRKAGSAAR